MGQEKISYFIKLLLHYVLYGKHFIGSVKEPLYSVCVKLNHEKQKSIQNVPVKKMVVFVKIFDHYHHNFSFGNFFSCPVNCKRIWNWSLDRNLIMALLIMAIYTVMFEKLYTILR